jgi:HSP20 family protein
MTMADTPKEPSGQAVAPRPAGTEWLDRWFGEWPRARFFPEWWRSLGEGPDLLRVEELVEGEELVVRAEMPGIDPDKDVQISVSDHLLHLQAERRQETKTKDKGQYRTEFQYGSFSRTLSLPEGTSEDDVHASYKDGILEVRIPVDRKKAEPKKIAIART